ncbi:MAG: AAA family ATPase [Burkholderiales bacterium]|nr:AAA family ATPase [Burkholderiales bacterium]
MPTRPRWRFGPFEADLQEHELRREGVPVAVTRKSFAVLAELLARPGKLVTKAELFDTVWAGSVVTDAALSRAIRELRVALGDDATAPRFIATAHGLGFRFVAALAPEPVASPEPTPAPPPAPEPRLVGRDADLARLDQALADARAGRRQLLFVSGEAGIGKTALVEAFVRRHAGADVWAAQGRCVEQYGTGEAYLPVLEALEHLASEVGTDAFRDVLLRYAPAWLAQLPWLAHDADRELLRRSAADSSVQRMLREIAQALEVLAARKPIVLWLEDLHWSDPSSLAVIAFLAGRRDPARLLVIATFRPADAQAGASPLHGLALQLAQRGQALQMALAPLDAGAVGQYLRARFGAGAPHSLAALGAFLHRRSDGNALFTVAMVDDLVRRRRLAQHDGAWVLHGSVDELGDGLPDDLRHLVHEQIERLGEDDRRLVEAAAVCGTDFPAASLAAALQADLASVEERCARLAQQGRFLRPRDPVTWPDGTVSAGFGFLHALYWQGTYERVSQSRRADWQRRIGLGQEQAFGAECGPIAAELAMRFEMARDFERSVGYLQRAGAAALSCCAYPECIELLRHALTLLPQVPVEQRAQREIDLLLPLGAALMATKGYASGDVEATYQRALSLCGTGARPGDLERVLRGLWNVAFLRADLARARQIAEQLLAQSEATGNARLATDAHTKLGQTCVHLGDLAPARFHLERALAASAVDGEDSAGVREAPRVAIYLSWALWYTGLPEQALRRAEEAISLAATAGSPHSSAFALGYSSQLHLLCGNLARELGLARQLGVLAGEHGLSFWRSLSDFTQGRAAAQAGDPAAGIARMRSAIDEMRSAGGLVGVPYLLCLLAEAELAAGRLDDARAALGEAAQLVAGNGNALYAAEGLRLLGEIELAEGKGGQSLEAAERSFRAALELARCQGSRALELRAATSLARLWADHGNDAGALGLLQPVFAAFGEGLQTADLLAASALLGRLRATSR